MKSFMRKLKQRYFNDRKRLIWDADGTLWNFWFYFCPFADKVIPYLAEQFGVTYEEIERELGRVFKHFGTHEPILPLLFTRFRRAWAGTDEAFYEICDRYEQMLEQSRRKNLVVYPEVTSTLETIYRRHKNNWMLSDGSMHNILKKLDHLKLISLFKGIVAVRAEVPPEDTFFKPNDFARFHQVVDESEVLIESWRRRGLILHMVDKTQQKPNLAGMDWILNMGDDGRRLVKPMCKAHVLMIGDNPGKDLGVAQAAGIDALWAGYGLYVPPAYIRMIDIRLTPDGRLREDGHGISYVPTQMPPRLDRLACVSEVLRWVGFAIIQREPRVLPADAFAESVAADE